MLNHHSFAKSLLALAVAATAGTASAGFVLVSNANTFASLTSFAQTDQLSFGLGSYVPSGVRRLTQEFNTTPYSYRMEAPGDFVASLGVNNVLSTAVADTPITLREFSATPFVGSNYLTAVGATLAAVNSLNNIVSEVSMSLFVTDVDGSTGIFSFVPPRVVDGGFIGIISDKALASITYSIDGTSPYSLGIGSVTLAVPEPDIWVLTLGGLAMMAAIRKRRAEQAAIARRYPRASAT